MLPKNINIILTNHVVERVNQRFELVDSDKIVVAFKKAAEAAYMLGRKSRIVWDGVMVVAAPSRKNKKDIEIITCWEANDSQNITG